MTGFKKSLLVISVIFLIYPIWIGFNRGSVEGFQFSLVTLPITVAIFAVNFSFIGYQFSPYRQILKFVSKAHLLLSASILLLSLLPLAISVSSQNDSMFWAAMLIPVITASSLWLIYLSRTESDAKTLLKKVISDSVFEQFIQQYSSDIFKHQKDIDSWKLSGPGDRPTHELSEYPSPAAPDIDPFETLVLIGLTSIQTSDAQVFETVLERSIELFRAVQKIDSDKWGSSGYKIKEPIVKHVKKALTRIAVAAIDEKSGAFATRFVHLISFYARNAARTSDQTSEFIRALIGISSFIARRKIEVSQEYSDAMNIISICREVCKKGIDITPDEGTQRLMFVHQISFYAAIIAEFGELAIEHKNSDFLYRCMDALGWLGCSAVKGEQHEVGKRCLQGLAQLGRIARAKKMECFWDRCALDPVDHADERLFWMMSWLASLPTESRGRWIYSCEEALSRLRGKEVKLSFKTANDGKEILVYDFKDEPYKTQFSSVGNGTTGYGKVLDYSDSNMLRDLTIS